MNEKHNIVEYINKLMNNLAVRISMIVIAIPLAINSCYYIGYIFGRVSVLIIP